MSQGSWSMLKLWKTYVKVKIHELAKRSTTSCWWYNSFFWIKRNFYNSNIVRKARQQKYENEHWRRRRRGIYEEDDEWTGQKLTWKKGVCCIEGLHETNIKCFILLQVATPGGTASRLLKSSEACWKKDLCESSWIFQSHTQTFFLKFSLECVMIR